MKTIYAIFDENGHFVHAEADACNATQHILDAVDMGIEGAGKWIARLYASVSATPQPTADHIGEPRPMFARDVWESLGYVDWRNFENVVHKAKHLIADGLSEGKIEECSRTVSIGSGAVRAIDDYSFDGDALALIKIVAALKPAPPQKPVSEMT